MNLQSTYKALVTRLAIKETVRDKGLTTLEKELKYLLEEILEKGANSRG